MSNHSKTLDPESIPQNVNRLADGGFDEFLKNGWFLALDSERILAGWGESSNSPESAEAGATAQLFSPDFFMQSETNLAAGAWSHTTSWEILERSRFASLVLSGLGGNVNSDQRFQWVEPDRAGFEKQFSSIRKGMLERNLRKAVPIVFAKARGAVTRERKLSILANLTQQPAHLFPYGFWNKNEGMIGITPEILFTQKNEDFFETVALAGTRGKGQDEDQSAQELLRDPKERHEHQLVIDDIESVLKKMGGAQIAQTGVVFLPTLIHLKTAITGELKTRLRFDEIARALHPTPALGVAPRELGFNEMMLWDSTENRGRYGAPFGVRYRDPNGVEQRHCLVAIRNIQWQDSEVRLGSGCGIVPESEIEREWQELRLKRDSVKRMLGV